jgi:hypothetical protein
MNDTAQPITIEQALWLAESLVRAAREAAAAGRTTLPADTFSAPARAAFEALGAPAT